MSDHLVGWGKIGRDETPTMRACKVLGCNFDDP
jgi:hypothetical protein